MSQLDSETQKQAKTIARTPKRSPRAKAPDQLPATLRRQLDHAITHRPPRLKNLNSIYDEFKLETRRVSRASFARYARLVMWRAQIAHIGHLVRAFVGTLPPDEHDRWIRTAHMMLTARLIEWLERDRNKLPLATLVQLIKTLPDRSTPTRPNALRETETTVDIAHESDSTPRWAETIQDLYGLKLEKRKKTKTHNAKESKPSTRKKSSKRLASSRNP